MSSLQNCSFTLALLLFLSSSPMPARNACDAPSLQHQRKDAATIERLENAWTLAFLTGDTDFERCLLSPDFTEIVRSGEVKVFADELAMAAKNRGKNLSVPESPKPAVLIHGDVAVAYGTSSATGTDGKQRTTRYADYYAWERGRWHAFFAQQTPVAGN